MTVISDRQAGNALSGYTILGFGQLKTLDGATAELEDAVRFITTIATDLGA
ncbi:hypothetical protein BH18ACI1_BH18ACI1_05230 [soil metagenome]|nr:hypothetical protein [Acidobacteriota bacterium]